MNQKPGLCIAARIVGAAIIAILLVATTGCVERTPSRFAGLTPGQARALAMDLARERDEELRADLRSAFADHPPVNVLVLSGGDAHGAFGCGVLAGWRDSANDPRPRFDIVTGVSTGALMATFAFLGEPQDDAVLRDLYLHVHDKDIFQASLGPPDAVFDTAPLRHLIDQHVTPDVLRRIAAAHRQGRRLYVATVELDTGSLFIWPMSGLAAEAMLPNGTVDSGKLNKFRSILLASASIPVFFPPVQIDGGLHVDAGLRAALFLHEAMLGINTASAGNRTPTTAPSPSPPAAAPTVWVIFCGQLGEHAQPVDADVLHIGTRSLDVFTHAVEILSIREAAYMAAGHDPPFRFRWISEPATDDPGPAVPGLFEPMFDPKVMSRFYDNGKTLASTDHAWQTGPPPMETESTIAPEH